MPSESFLPEYVVSSEECELCPEIEQIVKKQMKVGLRLFCLFVAFQPLNGSIDLRLLKIN